LALGQFPDGLFIGCSDSRVVPNIFASTNPGDLFVIRNVGNIVPSHEACCKHPGFAEAAAIEFALANLPITDIIICGHSECGAMQSIANGLEKVDNLNLKTWLSQSNVDPVQIDDSFIPNPQLEVHNQLSQLNVLQQIKHLKTHPLIQEKMAQGTINFHGWYFDIGKGDVYSYEEQFNQFILIDETEAKRILSRLLQPAAKE
jgi:carbonic anhydrase